MTPEQFCYWLNGFFELSTQPPTIDQWNGIYQRLETVCHEVRSSELFRTPFTEPPSVVPSGYKYK